MDETGRFSNVLGDDYELITLCLPHYDEYEKKLGQVIRDYCSTLTQSSIHALEIGVGTGITTAHLLDADPRIHITGLDNEKRTLLQAKERFASNSTRLQLIEAEALEYLRGMQPESMDIVVSASTIHNFPPEKRREVFDEIFRVAKRGGLFASADKYARNDPTEHSRDLQAQLQALEVYNRNNRPDLFEAWTQHYLADDTIKFTEAEQENLLRERGFTSITFHYRKKMEAVVTAMKQYV